MNAEVLSSDFATGLDLLADVVLNPTFPAAELEREREVQFAGIRAQKDHLLQSAALAMRRALFGERLRPRRAGQRDQRAGYPVANLKVFHQKLSVPNNCVLAIYGDVKTGESEPPWTRHLLLEARPQFRSSTSACRL